MENATAQQAAQNAAGGVVDTVQQLNIPKIVADFFHIEVGIVLLIAVCVSLVLFYLNARRILGALGAWVGIFFTWVIFLLVLLLLYSITLGAKP